ncbi:hypothetical protein [Mycolicibacterium bacteremicum]|uniref:hypothetical protein n=1 Tax=Mycolicibacterium bacteremicum TaxID=564198 RepID=UPI0026EACFF4|nr:hypothetical protein [Mycolicibacterium bacteremicum]
MQNAQSQRRCDRTDAAVESLFERVDVESDGDHIGDPLRRRYLSHHNMCSAGGHKAINLARNQFGHIGFPAERTSFGFRRRFQSTPPRGLLDHRCSDP